MTNESTSPRRGRRASLLIGGSFSLLAAFSATTPACLSRPLETIEPRRTATFTEALRQNQIDKIDILLAIDDSGSMSDKQAILAVTVPDLVDALANPPCLGEDGSVVAQPDGPLSECPDGSRREFDPVLDIHIGVISTSLGARGSWNECHDDNGALLSRLEDGSELPTFEDKGFLAWRPEDEGAGAGLYTDSSVLNADLGKMVRGVGQDGCGREAQLESWYRFLVDPDPYETIVKEGDRNMPTGTDTALLQQRADFLRDDSLVAVVMLSDENDCSFRADNYGYYTGASTQGQGILGLKARSECASNPADPCCAPCGHAPETCAVDPSCDEPIAPEERLINLSCFEQKRRYGIDLLYPTDRYVAAFTQDQITDRHGNLVDNPLLVSPSGVRRGQDRAFLAGIVGVPWQLVARNPDDLGEGFRNAQELSDSGTWNQILGDPSAYVPPSDPHMIESIHPREGLAGPGSSPGTDPIHGHEYNPAVTSSGPGNPIGDLQYACVFDLPDPIECGDGYCDCSPTHASNNPLCQAPDGSFGTTQLRAKAYPSLRQLEVLEGIGDSGIVGSICPAQIDDLGASDYGYRPAIGALIERIKVELKDPCFSRPLTLNEAAQVSCLVLESPPMTDGQACSCDYAPGRRSVPGAHGAAVTAAKEEGAELGLDLDCFCEIEQLADEELKACREQLVPQVGGVDVDGWCYVDPSHPQGGVDELVEHCPVTEKRTIRFVGEGRPVNDALMFYTCQQD